MLKKICVGMLMITRAFSETPSVYTWVDAQGHVHYEALKPRDEPQAMAIPVLKEGETAQQIYKWKDATGRVHYSQQQPENATAEMISVTPTPVSVPETEQEEAKRLKRLADELTQTRQAAEQARQAQAMRDLQRENESLKRDLLLEQQRQLQKKPEREAVPVMVISPPPPPAASFPNAPCQPWPMCRHTLLEKPPDPRTIKKP